MKRKISVLMSIYNEKLEWIQESVASILNQTYSNFELIIIVDNPAIDNNIAAYLGNLCQTDNRVVLLYNETNIGLAETLNRGIAIAKGEFIARMDADDISDIHRFELELNELESKKLDMVGTGKVDINEEGNLISEYEGCIGDHESICTILPYSSCFVHPSVMIRSKVLKDVDGYRNFKQSQDYDLWLRLLTNGCKFGNIDKPLIRYRVRKGSITGKRPYCQYLTSYYHRKLYRQRRRKKNDSFSVEHFESFLKKKKAYDEHANEKYLNALSLLNGGITKIKRKKLFSAVFCILNAIVCCPYMACVLHNNLKVYTVRRRIGR